MNEFLKMKHAENYTGLDDDMPDAFDEWSIELGVDEWVELAEEYKTLAVQEERERVIEMLTPRREWEKFMKFNNKYEYCKLCGFNPGKIIKAINQQ